MTSAHHHSHLTLSLPPPPTPASMQNEFKLPSLKDLNFQYRSPVTGPSQDNTLLSSGASTSSEHGSQNYSASSRREWSRSTSVATSANASVSHLQHSPQPSAHEQQSQQPQPQQQQHLPQKQASFSGYQHDTAYFAPNIAPSSHSLSGSQNTREDPSKRPRSASNTISNSPAHSPHGAYPPSSYPPSQLNAPSFHQHHPHPAPLPHDQVHHAPPYHGGYPYPPPYVQQRQPPHMPPHAHPHAQHQLAPAAYTQSPAHWPPIPPPAQQHSYANVPHFGVGFHRTTALVPTNLDPRSAYPPNAEAAKSNARLSLISEIENNCKILYDFASRYTQLQSSLRHVQPRRDELAEMAQRAANVVKLLEDLKRMALPGSPSPSSDKADLANSANGDDHRPPKRPWEEISTDAGQAQQPQTDASAAKRQSKSEKSSNQSLAEKDMEIIRTKRASTNGNNTSGQPKSKYRKRSRASPPGKCHSCNIRETPEWRRGPDGARTLCNACGLHYAKLMRKQDKHPDGKPITIDLQTLRASTVQARGGATFAEKSPLHAQLQSESSPQSGHRQDEDMDSKQTDHGASVGGKPYTGLPQNGDLNPTSPPPSSLPLPSMMTSESGLPMPSHWVARGSGHYGDHSNHAFRANPSPR